MALEINTAGVEFVKTVITLYRSATYFREKEILSKKLLDYSIETGRLVTALSTCSEEAENAIARKALEELDKTLFVLKVMGEDGIYPQRRMTPVEQISAELRELINLYVTEEHPMHTVEQSAPPVAQSEKVPEQRPLLIEDNGGFNEIYTGNE